MDFSSDSALSSPPSSRLSSPLSLRSKSPTPPCDYPSPSLTLSSSRSPSKTRDSSTGIIDSDGSPPKKKRKLAEPKERTTEYLDLASDDRSRDEGSFDDEVQLQRLLRALRTKQKIVVIAGAGISVAAGIPDFRSSTGLFTTLRGKHKLKASGKHLFDASVYKSDSSTSSFHDMIRELSHQTRNAQPTLFHHMLATLSEEGRLLRLYTQNVDGIDTSLAPLATDVPLNMKGPWPKTIQLHGGLGKMVCTKCHELSDFDGQLFEGPEPPSCKSCEELEQTRIQFGKKRSHGVGRLRPRMVLYNEFNPEEDAIGAVARNDLQKRPDAVIVVGTSLKIPGVRRMVREMCAVTRGRRDGFTAFINNGPEPIANEFKDSWDLVVRGDCQDVARYAALPKWNDKDIGNYSDVSEEDMMKATSKAKVEVILEAKHKVVEKTQGMLTPMASPRHQSPVPMKSGITIKIPKFTPDGASGKVAGSKISKSTTKAATKKKPSKKATTAKPLNKITLNKITNAFSVTKTTTLSEKSAKVPAVRSTAPEVLDIKPPTTPMGPLSPCEVRNNTDLSSHSQHDHDSSLLRDQLLSDAAKSISPVQNRHETISPKGKLPSNMEHLIDVDESLS